MSDSASPSPAPTEDRTVVRHRRRRRHSFRMESESEARRRFDRQALRFILPAIMLVVGIILLRTVTVEPDPELRPARLLRLGWWLTGVGGAFLLLAITVFCVSQAREAAKRAKNDADADNDDDDGHHHHHHHHHSHSDD